ncbi:MAG: 3-hydroxyacyl-CoA dehydrogenase family protein [Sulfitobacter sp.]
MTGAEAVQALQDAFWQAGDHLLFHHTNPWELDEALCAWGYDMGPCEAQDLLGLEKVLSRAPQRSVPILPRMVAEGRMGKGGGVGYYRYPGGGGAVIDPLIEDLILEEAWFGKVTRSERSDEALVAAMHEALRPICEKLRAGGTDRDRIVRLLHRAIHFPRDGQTAWF